MFEKASIRKAHETAEQGDNISRKLQVLFNAEFFKLRTHPNACLLLLVLLLLLLLLLVVIIKY